MKTTHTRAPQETKKKDIVHDLVWSANRFDNKPDESKLTYKLYKSKLRNCWPKNTNGLYQFGFEKKIGVFYRIKVLFTTLFSEKARQKHLSEYFDRKRVVTKFNSTWYLKPYSNQIRAEHVGCLNSEESN